ncbi:MAG: hypothetical protein B7X10_03495, partial [Burkholderiales bacterium 21-58-4]
MQAELIECVSAWAQGRGLGLDFPDPIEQGIALGGDGDEFFGVIDHHGAKGQRFAIRLAELIDLKAIAKAQLRIVVDPFWGAGRG